MSSQLLSQHDSAIILLNWEGIPTEFNPIPPPLEIPFLPRAESPTHGFNSQTAQFGVSVLQHTLKHSAYGGVTHLVAANTGSQTSQLWCSNTLVCRQHTWCGTVEQMTVPQGQFFACGLVLENRVMVSCLQGQQYSVDLSLQLIQLSSFTLCSGIQHQISAVSFQSFKSVRNMPSDLGSPWLPAALIITCTPTFQG